MSYSVESRWGDTLQMPNDRQLDELLDSLSIDDERHPCVVMTHDSGCTLSVYAGGLMVLGDRHGSDSRHMSDLSRQQVLSLWHSLARGETEALESHAWQEGSRPAGEPF